MNAKQIFIIIGVCVGIASILLNVFLFSKLRSAGDFAGALAEVENQYTAIAEESRKAADTVESIQGTLPAVTEAFRQQHEAFERMAEQDRQLYSDLQESIRSARDTITSFGTTIGESEQSFEYSGKLLRENSKILRTIGDSSQQGDN